MRVGLVIYGSLETISGGYLYDRRLVDHLRGCGDEVDIISLPWRTYPQHLLDNLSRALRKRLQRGGYDVALQDELNHPSLFWLNGAPGSRPMPLVSIVHHLRISEARPAWQNALYRPVEQRYLNSVDAFICNSHTTAAVVAGLLDAPRPSLVAFPGRDHLAVPTRASGAPGHDDGPLRLLFVGNLIRRKGLHTLLQALAQLPPHEWTLAVVGDHTLDPAYGAEIARLITQLPLGARVTRHGRVDDATLAGLYATAHALIVPSSYEGYGIVYVEAMGYGLPVIASERGAAAEIVHDGRSGYLIPPDDAAVLARRLMCWLDDRRLLATMSGHARERYDELPTWAETGAAVREFLQAQIARHRERR